MHTETIDTLVTALHALGLVGLAVFAIAALPWSTGQVRSSTQAWAAVVQLFAPWQRTPQTPRKAAPTGGSLNGVMVADAGAPIPLVPTSYPLAPQRSGALHRPTPPFPPASCSAVLPFPNPHSTS